MDKFKIDYGLVLEKLKSDSAKMPLAGNEHRLVRVAFDLFRLKDGDPEELWQVQSNDDGEFLVRTFSVPDEEKIAESSDWAVALDKKEANLTVSYRQMPIVRLIAKDYGANTPEDARLLRRAVYGKLTTDEQFGEKLIASFPVEKQKMLKKPKLHPETCTSGLSDLNIHKNSDDKSDKTFRQKLLFVFDRLSPAQKRDYKREFDALILKGLSAPAIEKLLDKYYKMVTSKKPQTKMQKSDDEWKLAFLDLHINKNSALSTSEKEELDEKREIGEFYENEEAEPEFEYDLDDEPKDYSDYFMAKCKEHGINPNDIPGLSEEQRKTFFEDVDAGWKAKNECIDPVTQRQMLETGVGPMLKKKESLMLSKRAANDCRDIASELYRQHLKPLSQNIEFADMYGDNPKFCERYLKETLWAAKQIVERIESLFAEKSTNERSLLESAEKHDFLKKATEQERRERLYSKLADPSLMKELHEMIDRLQAILPSISTETPRSRFVHDLINEARKHLGQVEGWIEGIKIKEEPETSEI